MGVVRMRQDSCFLSRGYPCVTDEVFVYCDQCGSFDIKTYVGLRKWLLLAGSVGLIATATFKWHWSGHLSVWWMMLGPAAIIAAFGLFWGEADCRCRRCRKATTTQYNTLGYPSDMAIVDVPEKLAQKRYLQYWPDLCDLDEALKPPHPPANPPPSPAPPGSPGSS